MLVMFELDRDKIVVERKIYTVLDLLSDIGGIQGLVTSFLAIIITLLNADSFEEHLIGQLYTYKTTKSKPSVTHRQENYFTKLSLYGFKCINSRRRSQKE